VFVKGPALSAKASVSSAQIRTESGFHRGTARSDTQLDSFHTTHFKHGTDGEALVDADNKFAATQPLQVPSDNGFLSYRRHCVPLQPLCMGAMRVRGAHLLIRYTPTIVIPRPSAR
jgi:hypothetical protein